MFNQKIGLIQPKYHGDSFVVFFFVEVYRCETIKERKKEKPRRSKRTLKNKRLFEKQSCISSDKENADIIWQCMWWHNYPVLHHGIVLCSQPLAIRRMSAWTTLPTEIHIVLGFAYPKQRWIRLWESFRVCIFFHGFHEILTSARWSLCVDELSILDDLLERFIDYSTIFKG